MFKYTANIITLMRIPLAVAILWAVPFSDLFWMIYICCGMTDIVDGFVAGTFHQESMLGSKLDSIADLVFAASMMIFIAINIAIPDWMWLCILIVALLRLTGYGIGFCRFHTYASLHTYANKITGAAIFLFPLFYRFCGLMYTGIILFILSLISALEELMIILRSKKLDRNCKGLFDHSK